jgi:MFS family permease
MVLSSYDSSTREGTDAMSANSSPGANASTPVSEPDLQGGLLRRFRTAPTPGEPGRWSVFASRLPLRDARLPAALQRGPFKRYWASQIVALAGGWMQNTASSLVVLSITTSAFLIGIINVVSAVPLLLLSLYGGVIADRLDRRKIILVCQSLIGLISLVYAFMIITDQLEYWHVLVLAAAAGTIMAFSLPASQAFVAELVSRENMPEALALNSASFNATRTVGPALAGVVIGALGMASAFIINALSLLAPIWVLIGLRDEIPPHQHRGRASGKGAMRQGMHHIRTHDDLFGLVLLSAVFSFLVFPNLLVLMPLYVVNVLGGGSGWVSIMISVLGVGSLTGSIGILRGSRREVAAGKRLRRSMAGLTIGLVWLALAANPWLAIPGILISGFSFTTGNTQINTTLQQLAPDELRGRVLSVNGLAFNGVMPFATLGVAGLSQVVGQRAVMIACAVLMVVMCLWLWRRYVWQAYVPPAPVSSAET